MESSRSEKQIERNPALDVLACVLNYLFLCYVQVFVYCSEGKE